MPSSLRLLGPGQIRLTRWRPTPPLGSVSCEWPSRVYPIIYLTALPLLFAHVQYSFTAPTNMTKKANNPIKLKKAPQAPRRFKSAYMFFSTGKHKEIRSGMAIKVRTVWATTRF